MKPRIRETVCGARHTVTPPAFLRAAIAQLLRSEAERRGSDCAARLIGD
jgi:hypothetical protein